MTTSDHNRQVFLVNDSFYVGRRAAKVLQERGFCVVSTGVEAMPDIPIVAGEREIPEYGIVKEDHASVHRPTRKLKGRNRRRW